VSPTPFLSFTHNFSLFYVEGQVYSTIWFFVFVSTVVIVVLTSQFSRNFVQICGRCGDKEFLVSLYFELSCLFQSLAVTWKLFQGKTGDLVHYTSLISLLFCIVTD